MYSLIVPEDIDGIVPDSTQKKPMISKKWEKIGFLGSDLQNEFRGVGIFGGLMLLYLASNHSTLVNQMYQLSNDSKRKFPLAIALLHFLNLTMQVAKEGYLNEFINTKKSVLKVIQTLYVSICEQFYRIWNHGNFTESKFHNIVHVRIEEKIRDQWFSLIQSHTLATKTTRRRRVQSEQNKKIE
jgi:hypothetical protein